MSREELVNDIVVKLDKSQTDREEEYNKGKEILDKILEEVDDYKRRLGKHDIKLNINCRQNKFDPSSINLGLDTSISIEGIPSGITIDYQKNTEEFNIIIRGVVYIIPFGRATGTTVHVLQAATPHENAGTISYAELVDRMIRMLKNEIR